MIRWLARWWRQRQRATDMDILWPACKEHAGTLEHARAAMMVHCMNDSAWTTDYTEEDLIVFIGQLN